jgi:hypothetical protein
MLHFSEDFVSIFKSKLDYYKTPEKSNSTDSDRGLTDGMIQAIFGFRHYGIRAFSESGIYGFGAFDHFIYLSNLNPEQR